MNENSVRNREGQFLFNLIGRNYRCKVSGPTFFDRETLATNSFSHDITREKSLKNLKKWSHLINPEF